MHSTTKSDLIECLESVVPSQETVPVVDAKERIATFKDYTDFIFIPSIKRMLEPVLRLDVVWDIYLENSLKSQTRLNRGSGAPIKMEKDTKLSRKWRNFLRCDRNKDCLFKLLATAIQELQFPSNKHVISTLGNKVVSSPITCTGGSELYCTHEEADTLLLFHAQHII